MQEIVDAIIRVIVDRLNPQWNASALSESTPLAGEGLALDSVSALELVTGLEDELDIMIDESQLNPEVFENIGSLARFVHEHAS